MGEALNPFSQPTFSPQCGPLSMFRKRSMPFLTVNAIIGNQAFQNARCSIWFSLGLDKVATGYNLMMELKYTPQMLNCSHSHWFSCG